MILDLKRIHPYQSAEKMMVLELSEHSFALNFKPLLAIDDVKRLMLRTF